MYTLPDIDKKTQKRLTSGKDKIRLALYLKGESDPYPLVLFARLVWSNEEKDVIRCGFIFTDIMPEQYTIINAIINENLKEKEELG